MEECSIYNCAEIFLHFFLLPKNFELMKKTQLSSLIFLLFTSLAYAQTSSAELDEILDVPSLTIKKTREKIIPDGKLDEAIWNDSDLMDNFWQQFPADSTPATGQTEIRMLYDDNFLYIGVKCYSNGENYVTPSLRRDYRFPGSDNVSMVFDTYNDKTNALMFGMNPFGVQREALIANGGRQGSDFEGSWDNKWFGDAHIYGDYWTAEFAIPFNTLRFNEGSEKWRFNCYRSDTQHNEWSTWARIPRNRLVMDLSFMGDLHWEEPLEKTGSNFSLIPYAITSATRDFEDENQNSTDWTGNIGGDAKIAVTSGLNLDLTLNPDFSQVEVDQQVTNLNRFEILFPERRQFFLENADLFNSFGISRVNPFFSRRIGISIDTTTGQNIQNTILYGARLNGKLNDNLRVGLLNMQTAKQEESGLPAFNYTVATLQQKVFNRSNVSFIFVNKDAINGEEGSDLYNKYNRVAGLEYRLASPDGKWTGKAYYHQAFTPTDEEHKFTQGFILQYLKRKYRIELAELFIGDGYTAEVGFVPRRDYMLLSPEFQVYFYPEKGLINTHSIAIDTRFFFQAGKADTDFKLPDWSMSEWQVQADWAFQLNNNTRGQLSANITDLTLLNAFDPTRLQDEGVELAAGSRHQFISFEGNYTSDNRKKFIYSLRPNIGQFFNGFRAGMGGTLTMRYQPYGSIGLAFDYNFIELEAPFEPVNIWLIGPRIDLTFTKDLFLTAFIQYNNQLDNLNINTRFQWRFAPVSDFFIVYTDNYLVDSMTQFGARNRALVAKVTYWLNL